MWHESPWGPEYDIFPNVGNFSDINSCPGEVIFRKKQKKYVQLLSFLNIEMMQVEDKDLLTLLMLETEYSGFGDQYHACWTDARDWQKQHWSSKTTVYAGPKDWQSILLSEIPISVQGSTCLITIIFVAPMCSIWQELGFCCIWCHITWWNHDLETTFLLLHISSVHQK